MHTKIHKAIDTFKVAIERFPTISRLWKGLQETYEGKGDHSLAQKMFVAATEKFPEMSCRWKLSVSNPSMSSKISGHVCCVWLLARDIARSGIPGTQGLSPS